MNKLARGDDITTDIVGKICTALDVKADDIMEFIYLISLKKYFNHKNKI